MHLSQSPSFSDLLLYFQRILRHLDRIDNLYFGSFFAGAVFVMTLSDSRTVSSENSQCLNSPAKLSYRGSQSVKSRQVQIAMLVCDCAAHRRPDICNQVLDSGPLTSGG